MAEQQCPLIAVPIKLTEQVDLAAPIKSIITNSYGEDPAKHAEHLNMLNRARQDAVKEGGAGNIATQRDLLFKWFHILELLELRFPELRIPFPWKDAFTKKPISQYSIAYEKASVIFNIASTLSSFAASQGRHAGNPEGLKRAYTSFRQAAGMFAYINENFLHAPSTDMSREVVKALVDLMLAQASEVFLEKTVEERKGNALVAKIASHTASIYASLSEDMKEWVNKNVFDRLWLMVVQIKAKYFASVTQYYRALADDAKGDHGVCLVRLTLAENLAREGSRLMAPFNASMLAAVAPPTTLPSDAATALTALVSTHLALCTGRKEVAIKDNDLIYHDILPSESALEPVDKFAAASPISIQDIYATPDVQKSIGQVDLFSKLVPLGVHESASMYSEEKAKLARAESERHDVANGELQAALDYMGLPDALKVYRDSEAAVADLTDPGSEVMKWSEEEANGGGARGADGLGDSPDGIDTALHQIGSYRLKASQELEASGNAIDEETRECERNRAKYDYRWSQEPSSIENKDLRQELKLQREALAAAKANDEKIETLWKQINADLRLLSRGRDALEQAFAEVVSSASTSGNGAKDQQETSLLDLDDEAEDVKKAATAEHVEKMRLQVKHLESLLAKLPKIKKERAEVLGDLKERIQSDDISHLLILNRRTAPASGQETSLFQAELEKFKPHQQRIALSIKQQTAIVAEVTEAWKELTESESARRTRTLYEARKRARTGLVDRLRKARDGYAEVRAAVHRGLQFYDELGTIAAKLRQDTDAFVRQRRSDAQKLANEIEWENKLKSPEQAVGQVPLAGLQRNGHDSQSVAAVPQPAPVASGTTSQMASLYNATAFASPASPHASAGPTRGPGPPPPPPPATSAFASQYGTSTAPLPPSGSGFGTTTSAKPASPAPFPPPGQYSSFPPPPPQQQQQPSGQHAYGPTSPQQSSPYSDAHSLSLTGLSLGARPAPMTTSALPPPPPQPFVSHYTPGQGHGQGSQYGSFGSVPSGAAGGSQYGLPSPPPPPPPQQQQHHQPQSPYGYASPTSSSGYGAPPPPPAPASGYGQFPPPPPPHGGYPSAPSPHQYSHAPPPPPPPQQQHYQHQQGQPAYHPQQQQPQQYHQQQQQQQPPPPPPPASGPSSPYGQAPPGWAGWPR